MNKIKNFLNSLENVGLILVSLISAVNSIFFIAREVEGLEFFAFLSSKNIYFLYGLVILAFLGIWTYILRRKVEIVEFIRKTLWIFLPTELIWMFGFSQSIHFNYVFKLLAGIYIIIWAFIFIFKYKKYTNLSAFFREFQSVSPESFRGDQEFHSRFPEISKLPIVRAIFHWFFSQGLIASFILVLVLVLNLGFGSYHLSKFAAVDEALWTQGRITKYWNNISEREWEKTKVSDKPGITVALISGAGLLKVNPKDYKDIKWEGEVVSPSKNVEEMNFAFRFPILLLNALMLLVFYVLLKKLLGQTGALLGTIFIGLSPILLGISTIINPDSLLWVFVPLSILSYLVYLKNGENKYLYMSGIFAGFSILTKYVANIIYVFFFGLIFLEYIVNRQKYEELSVAKYLKKSLINYAILVFFSVLIYYIFLPESWVRFKVLLEGTLFSQAFEKVWPFFVGIIAAVVLDMFFWRSKILAVVLNRLAKAKSYILGLISLIFVFFILATILNTYLGMKFYDLEMLLASPKTSHVSGGFLGLMLANFYSLIFGIAPIAFLAVVILGIRNIFSKKRLLGNNVLTVYLMIFILVYYLASTVDQVSSTVRYQIILYPLIFVVAGIGISEFMEWKKIKKYLPAGVVFVIMLVASVYSLNFIRPFYFSYASSLLPNEYVLNLKDMGDGSYEAAQFLNSLPNAKSLLVWSDKRGVCTFFMGRCKSGLNVKKGENIFDYFVVSSGRESRTSKLVLSRVNSGSVTQVRLDELYDSSDTVFKLEIGSRPNNFVKIIKGEKVKQN